jgi:hypothetical protein
MPDSQGVVAGQVIGEAMAVAHARLMLETGEGNPPVFLEQLHDSLQTSPTVWQSIPIVGK